MFGLPDNIISQLDKRNGSFYKILKNSLKIKKEHILIISDYGKENNNLSTMLAYGYHSAAKSKSLNVNLLFQEVKKGFMHADSHVVDAIKRLPPGNIVILCLSNKLGRFGQEKSFRNYCRERQHRFLSATGLGDVNPSHLNLFLEAMTTNYKRMKKKGMAIKRKWDKAKEIRVKTEAGTNITFNVEGMTAIANIGEYHDQGLGGNMPAGEIYIPPKGISNVNGTFVIDGSMKTENGAVLLDEPVTVVVETGRVVAITGKHAHLLERTFQKFEARAKYPERVRLVAELGIGINPAAVLIGSMIIDEKVLGTGHIAIGSNSWFGGAIKTIYHGDQVFKNPTFYIDGEKLEL
tara:strand:- start:10467 stop:11513 length:1047 start_codon:yes stop_codon:yes gene_type:complete